MTHEEIEIQTTETRSVQLPYFAKLGSLYIWVAGKKTNGGPMGHAIYTDGSISLNTSCVSDAWHVNAVEVTADEFWARWRDAVTELEALGNYEGGANLPAPQPEKWQPKPEEWCCFWDDGHNEFLVAQFKEYRNNSVYPYKIIAGSGYKHCAPFTGELPEHLEGGEE